MMARNGGRRQKGQMRANLWWCGEDVQELADEVIAECHARLSGDEAPAPPIRYAFQGSGLKVRGRAALGKIEIISGKTAMFEAGLPSSDVVIAGQPRFFLITLSKPHWNNLKAHARASLLDSLLTGAGVNAKGGMTIVRPDVEEHSEVIERRGLWRKSLRNLGVIVVKATAQQTMDFEDVDEEYVEEVATASADRGSAEVAASNEVAAEAEVGPEFAGMLLDACTKDPLALVTDEPMDPASAVGAVVEDAPAGPQYVTMADLVADGQALPPEAALADSLDAEHEAELERRAQSEKQAAMAAAEEARQAGQSFEATQKERRSRRRSAEPLTVVTGGAAA